LETEAFMDGSLFAWHQDRAIAVRDRVDVPGFGPWSVKAGLVHVEPPVDILERMLAVRLHLDDCGEDNGPLRVLPGSHAWAGLDASRCIAFAPAATVLPARLALAMRCGCARCCRMRLLPRGIPAAGLSFISNSPPRGCPPACDGPLPTIYQP
jgi:hypothetical protein